MDIGSMTMSELEDYLELAKKVEEAIEEHKKKSSVSVEGIEDAFDELHGLMHEHWQEEQ